MKKLNKKHYLLALCMLLVMFIAPSIQILQKNGNTNNLSQNVIEQPINKEVIATQENTSSSILRSGTPIPDYYCLRDEMIIYTEDQNSTGLCWDFTCNKIIESLFAKRYNTYIDLSESWIALCDKVFSIDYPISSDSVVYIGGGGTINKYIDIINNYGIMLEEDFSQDYLHNLDSENYSDYYKLLKKYSIKNYSNAIEKVFFSQTTNDYIMTNKEINAVKNHLINNSAIYLRIDSTQINESDKINYLDSYIKPEYSWHSVTIIGWDDNIKITDVAKNTHKGAWIALNSWGENWGNDGIFYIPYDAKDLGECCGLYLNQTNPINEFFLNKEEDASSYQILNKYKYSSYYSKSKGEINQYNVFEQNSLQVNVKLNYTLSIKDDFEINNVTISRSGKQLTELFNIELNETNLKIHSKQSNLESGTYKITLLGNNNKKHILTFYILSGAEVGVCRTFYSDNLSTSRFAATSRYLLANNLATNNTVVVEEFLKKNASYFTMLVYVGTYSKVANITTVRCVSVDIDSKEQQCLIYAVENNYSQGFFYITMGNLSEGKNIASFTINTLNGNSINYSVILYKYNVIENYGETEEEEINQANESLLFKQSRISIIYDAEMSYNTNIQGTSMYYLYKNNTIELVPAEKKGYTFCGWYSDRDLTKEVTEITKSLIIQYNGTNHMMNNYGISNAQTKTIYLYAKFLEIDINCNYDFIAYEKYFTDSDSSYKQMLGNKLVIGNKIKILVDNLNFNVVDNIIDKNQISYKILWNGEQSQFYESPKNNLLTENEIILGEKQVLCQIVFYYLDYKITSCKEEFTKTYNYEITTSNICGENKLGGTLNVPQLNLGSLYGVTYDWYVGNGTDFSQLEQQTGNTLFVDENFAEKVVKCKVNITKIEDNSLVNIIDFNPRYIFATQYSIVFAYNIEENEISIPIVNNPIYIEANMEASKDVSVKYVWKYINENNEEIVIPNSNETILTKIPKECGLKKLFCQVETTFGEETNIQKTNAVTILDVCYEGHNVYGGTLSIGGISDDYDYRFNWSNDSSDQSITIDKYDMQNQTINCAVDIYLDNQTAVGVELPSITLQKRDIEIKINDCESFYGNPLAELTYDFTENKSILPEDSNCFKITLTKQSGQNISTFYIFVSTFKVLDSSILDYYNPNYTTLGSGGEFGIYTIKKLEFDFSNTKLIVKESGAEYTNTSFTYDNKVHEVELTNIPEGIEILEYEGNININAGEYNLKIKEIRLTEQKYVDYYEFPDLENLTWTWKINKQVKDFYYNWDYQNSFAYNGKVRAVKIVSKQEFPEGLKIIYTDNEKINAGHYLAICQFDQSELKDKNYAYNFIGEDLNWEIRKGTYYIEYSWDYNQENPFIYNGEEQKVMVFANLPEMITIEYLNNSNVKKDAGQYIAQARFVYDTNNINLDVEIEDLNWEIKKCTIDLTSLNWNYNGSVVYNGTLIRVELDSLPEDINVTYENNENSEPGKYTAIAKLDYNEINYNLIYDESLLVLDWEIEKQDNKITVLSKSYFGYNGLPKTIKAISTRDSTGKSLILTYKYRSSKDNEPTIFNKTQCIFVGYYTVIIEDLETEYYKGAKTIFEYTINKTQIQNEKYMLYSPSGFGFDSYIKTSALNNEEQQILNLKFKRANILESFTLNVINDYQKDDKNVELTIELSDEIKKENLVIYKNNGSGYKIVNLIFNEDLTKCIVYCSIGDQIVLIDGSDSYNLSICIIIFILLFLVAIYLLMVYFLKDYKLNIFKSKKDNSQNELQEFCVDENCKENMVKEDKL